MGLCRNQARKEEDVVGQPAEDHQSRRQQKPLPGEPEGPARRGGRQPVRQAEGIQHQAGGEQRPAQEDDGRPQQDEPGAEEGVPAAVGVIGPADHLHEGEEGPEARRQPPLQPSGPQPGEKVQQHKSPKAHAGAQARLHGKAADQIDHGTEQDAPPRQGLVRHIVGVDAEGAQQTLRHQHRQKRAARDPPGPAPFRPSHQLPHARSCIRR